jgi:hypothetical protein
MTPAQERYIQGRKLRQKRLAAGVQLRDMANQMNLGMSSESLFAKMEYGLAGLNATNIKIYQEALQLAILARQTRSKQQ